MTSNPRSFRDPVFSYELRVEQNGMEVSIIFVLPTQEKANAYALKLIKDLTDGNVTIVLKGKPTSVEEYVPPDTNIQ